MKKNMMSIGVILAAIFTLSSCVDNLDNVQVDRFAGVQFELSASLMDTKTANDGLKTLWTADDAISVYHAVAGSSDYVSDAEFTVAEDDLMAGTFKGTLVSALEASKSYDWVALYPYVQGNNSPKTAKVTIGNVSQSGDNTTAHLAGSAFPMWGVDSSVEAAARPTLAMTHLSSILEVVVVNSSAAAITVNKVAFTASEEVAGEFAVDLTAGTPVFTAVPDNASKTSTLNVTGAAALANGESAKYYLSVKPFTAAAGSELVLSVNGIERRLEVSSDVVFAAGHIKTLNLDYDQVAAPVVTAEKVAFSSATLNWTSDGLATSFNIYVGGQKKATVGGDIRTYDLTGIPTGAESKVSVEAVGEHNTEMSAELTLKTAGIRVIDRGEHHVTIEWDDLMERPLTGNGAGRDNGYMIGVYTDDACTEKVYEIVPYDGVANEDYMMGNSSFLGKIGGTPYYIPTKLALGTLRHSTTYYIRVRTLDGFNYTYNSKEYALTSKFGNSEWSDPISVTTLAEHVPSAKEVIFENFDQMSCMFDRFNGICGTFTSDYVFGSVDDLRVQVPKTEGKSVRICGFSTALTGQEGDYLTGKTFPSFGTTYAQSVGNAGYSFEGWHFVDGDCIRPSMGSIYIDAAQKRFVGTPLLEKNLDDTEKKCVLTFQMATLRKGNSYDVMNESVFIKRIRKVNDSWEQTEIETISVTTPFEGTPTSTDYRSAFGTSQKYTVELDLKRGDAVAIVAHNASSKILVILDDILIETK